MKNATVKSSVKAKTDVTMIAVSAMFAALITVTTAFIKIPTAIGYSHAGDSMIYLASSILPAPYAVIASAIGGALADLLSGYAIWAIPTAIIKSLNVVPFIICRHFLKKYGKDGKILSLPTVLMIIPTTLVTVGGYFVANTLLYGFAAAVADLAVWYLQPGIGAIIYLILGAGLDAINFKNKIYRLK